MGQMFDEISQVLLYSAADVVVAPSMQENLSNTVMESLSCGTPVVAFHIGGMPDMIEHQINGYLAKPFEANDLAEGIMWVLGNPGRTHLLSKQARQSVLERYALDVIASNYLSLYQSVIG
jgi:glycosyltransferase involved in cell wall biosynthesis